MSSAAVVIGTLRVNLISIFRRQLVFDPTMKQCLLGVKLTYGYV